MLNKEQLRKQVIQYFRSVGSGQNIVQCIKEALFLHERFSPIIVFEVISKGKQKITANDIRNFLLRHNIVFSEQELKYYLHQNQFQSEITLNEFLEALIPYNADVVREFKQKYLEALEIREFDPEIEFILTELLDNQLKFYRSLIHVRQEITKISSKKQIQNLIKEDLVLQSKPRESKKFHEFFQSRNCQLGFHELRKFLQIWLSSKEIIHQFYLLNVMRHLKSNNPFERIVFKNRKGKSVNKSSTSAQKRSISAKKDDENNLTNQKFRQKIAKDNKYDTYNGGFSGNKQEKYNEFKNDIIKEYIQDQHHLAQTKNKDTSKQPTLQKISAHQQELTEKLKRSNQKEENLLQNEQLRRSRYERELKGIDGSYLLQVLEEMVIKEERLQKLRKNLAKSNDFNLINLFKLIDYGSKGFVSSRDISDYSGINRVQFNHMVSFYARQYQKLRFHEFCLIFRPLSKQLNELIDTRQEHKVPNPFKSDTNKLILEVLTVTAEMHQRITQIKQKINATGINLSHYFRFVDLEEKGYISASCFQQVLSQHNIFVDDKDLKCLMKLFQKKIDERVSLPEFLKFLDL